MTESTHFKDSNIEKEIKKEIKKCSSSLNSLKIIKQLYDVLKEDKWQKILNEDFLQEKEMKLNKMKEKYDDIEKRKELYKNNEIMEYENSSYKAIDSCKELESRLNNTCSKDDSLQILKTELQSQLKDLEVLYTINLDRNIQNYFYKISDYIERMRTGNEILGESDGNENLIFNTSVIDNINNNSMMSNSTFESEIRTIKIESYEELIENINNNNSFKIESIVINGENFRDLSIFNGINFISLKHLELNSNNIKDLTPLMHCKLLALEELELENNLIDNESINIIKQLDLPKLSFLNIFGNKITSIIKTFSILSEKKLKKFHIGRNKFNEKELNDNKGNIIDLPDCLEELGLTGNFDKKTNYFIKNINISNLKTIYIGENELSSLEFLKEITFNRLESFNAPENNISDFKELLYIGNKEGIKEIKLNKNQITSIDEGLKMNAM